MKSVFDASFRYTPSFGTDVRKTFERLRRERQAQARRIARAAEPLVTPPPQSRTMSPLSE